MLCNLDFGIPSEVAYLDRSTDEMTVLGKRTLPLAAGLMVYRAKRARWRQPIGIRASTRLRRYARYIGNKRRKKLKLKFKVKKYLNKNKFKRKQRRLKSVIKQTLPTQKILNITYDVDNDEYTPQFTKYELGSANMFSNCALLPYEFKTKLDSYFYHRLYKFSWKIDQMEA